jgi:hypothetical protein
MNNHRLLRNALFILAQIVLLLSVACQTKLGYEKGTDWEAGYRDKQIGQDEFGVTVKGYPSTPPQRAARLALLRAAKLTVEQGREWFLVVEQIETTQKKDIMTPLYIPGPEGTALFVPVSIGTANEPIAFLFIRILEDGSTISDALNAEQVIAEVTKQLENDQN